MGDIVQRLRDQSDHYIAQHALDTMSEAANEIERLRAAIEDAVDTLEAMDLHTDNSLYDRLRAVVEQSPRETGK